MKKPHRQKGGQPSNLNLESIVDVPVSATDLPDPQTSKELDDLDRQERQAKIADLLQDAAERKKYAGRIFWLIAFWLAGVFALLLLQGVLSPHGWFSLSEPVLLAVVGRLLRSGFER